jgi:phospholipid transport system substrate-binding protein
MKKIIPAVLILFFLFPAAARPQQQEALAAVQTRVNEVLKVLRNPALQGPKGEAEKKAQITAEADKFFDFVELSRRTLGLEWNRFSMDQRKEFVSLFKTLLRDTYIDRITAYKNEKVDFVNAVPLGENAVEVRSEVVTQGGKVPIYYRVRNEGGQWKAYDVVIEGVSLITNYRSQFRQILLNQPPQGLIDSLKNKAGNKPS